MGHQKPGSYHSVDLTVHLSPCSLSISLSDFCYLSICFPCGSAGKESACNAGDLGLVPGLGRSPGGGKCYPLQYSGLENSMDCTVHGVTKSQKQLCDLYFHSLSLVNNHCSRFSLDKMLLEFKLKTKTYANKGNKCNIIINLKKDYFFFSHLWIRSIFLM